MAETSSTGAPCPICGKPSVREARPFCSRRCADIDLWRWLKGNYRVPTDERADPYDLGEARRDDDE